jgi:protein MpaA
MCIFQRNRNIVTNFQMNLKQVVISIFCAFFMALVFSGCAEPDFKKSELPTTPLPVQHRLVGMSVRNRPIMCLVHGFGPDVILIMATIHGNEPAGTPLVRQLNDYLQQHPELLTGRTVVLLPVANPDGLALGKRYNVNNVDLNRNFEAANRQNNNTNGQTAFSEPEARAIKQLILEYMPDRIVSIHQPLTCIDYDGPAQMLAEQMARYCDLPVKKLGARPGSLGSYAGVTLGIPIITFEMKKDDSNLEPEILWQRYGKALLALIIYPNLVK